MSYLYFMHGEHYNTSKAHNPARYYFCNKIPMWLYGRLHGFILHVPH